MVLFWGVKCPLSSRGVKNFFIQLVLFLSKNVRYIVEGIFVEREKIVTVILVKGVMPYVNLIRNTNQKQGGENYSHNKGKRS